MNIVADFFSFSIKMIKCFKIHIVEGPTYFLRDTKLYEAFDYGKTLKYVSQILWLNVIIQMRAHIFIVLSLIFTNRNMFRYSNPEKLTAGK